MPRLSRTLLILLLALPAVLVPRGVGLDWCLCGVVACGPAASEQLERACCADTQPACCSGAPERTGSVYAHPTDCACCKRLEVQDFDEVQAGAPPAPGVALIVCAPQPPPVAPAPVVPRAERVSLRAPPAAVTPAGLLPGVRPLLL
jgi:hypothetical protein